MQIKLRKIVKDTNGNASVIPTEVWTEEIACLFKNREGDVFIYLLGGRNIKVDYQYDQLIKDLNL